MTKKIANYEAPRLTVVEFRTERGFAASGDNLFIDARQAIDAYVNEELLIRMGETGSNGDVLAATMEGNHDYSNPFGTGWQYDNGSWF